MDTYIPRYANDEDRQRKKAILKQKRKEELDAIYADFTLSGLVLGLIAVFMIFF